MTARKMRVRVRDDATMWGEPDAAPSVYRGRVGEVGGPAVNGYDVLVDIEGLGAVGFFWRELEVVPDIEGER